MDSYPSGVSYLQKVQNANTTFNAFYFTVSN